MENTNPTTLDEIFGLVILAVTIWGLVAIFRAIFGKSHPRSAALRTSPGFDVHVVGESHRQEALRALCGGKKTDESAHLIKRATLTHDRSNKHDKNAIAVSIQGRLVGYLDRDRAEVFRQFMKDHRGVRALSCDAEIKGGWKRVYEAETDEGDYGVTLNLSWPPEIRRW
jgi:hypothetical protein